MTTETATLPIDLPRQPNPPPRPTYVDVIPQIVDNVIPAVIEWLGDQYYGDEESLRSDITDVIGYSRDGFERCRRLAERHFWTCDARLVEIMEAACGWFETDQAVKAWVEANGIRLTREVGQRVAVPEYIYGDSVGTIMRLDPDRASYIIATDRHRDENPEQYAKGSGFIVPFEKVSDIDTQEPAA